MATGVMTWGNYSGVLTNTKLNKMLRKVAQPLQRFTQFVDVKDAFGKNAGEAVNFPKQGNIGTYGGQLTETATMHESTANVTWGSATVQEYGNSIPMTLKSMVLSQLDVDNILRSGLVDDSSKVLDGLVEREFADTPLKYVATSTAAGGLSTGGTATATNTGGITTYHIRQMAFFLKLRNVPGYTRLGGRYAGIFGSPAVNSIRGDLVEGYGNAGFLGSETGAKIYMTGAVGQVHGVEIAEDNFATLFNYNPTARTATSKAANTSGRTTGNYTQASQWTGATTSADVYEAYVFGSPTVMEVTAIPVEIRRKEITDYGRSKGIAWYAILTYKLIWDAADNGDNARIVHFTAR